MPFRGDPAEGGRQTVGLDRRPYPSLLGHGRPSSQFHRVGRSASLRPRQLASYAGPQNGMFSRDVIRPVQHAAWVHGPSVATLDEHPYVAVPRFRSRVIESPAALHMCTMLRRHLPFSQARADRLCVGLRPPLHPNSLIARVSPTGVVSGHPDW